MASRRRSSLLAQLLTRVAPRWRAPDVGVRVTMKPLVQGTQSASNPSPKIASITGTNTIEVG